MSIDKKLIHIGTRVSCNLYGRGMGTVVAIHGAQSPDSVKTVLGRIGVSGGSAKLDVVFDDGSRSMQVSEAIVRGAQWRIFDERHTPEQISQSISHSDAVLAAKAREAAAAQQAHEDAKTGLRNSKDYAYLEQGDDFSGVLAGKNLRKQLAKEFPGVKFSVRKDSYGSVGIEWMDGPTCQQVDAIAERYKEGHFDGMEDIYKYDNNPWSEVFGGVKYFSTRRDHSPALMQKGIDALWEKYSGNFRGVEKITTEEFKAGKASLMEVPGLNSRDSVGYLIHKEMARIEMPLPARPERVKSRSSGMSM